MPKYSYKCANCGEISIFFHSMKETRDTCNNCNTSGFLTRIPSNFSLENKAEKQKIGAVVKQSIEEFREDLAFEREKLKNELFESDE